MVELNIKIAQVSRPLGGTLRVDGPPQIGQEEFIRPFNNNGKRGYNLLVGTYKVLLDISAPEPKDNPWGYSWELDQSNLMNLGATLTINLNPFQGTLEVKNGILLIEEGAIVARLIGKEIPHWPSLPGTED